MTVSTLDQLFVVGGHHPSQWKQRLTRPFIVSLLFHALLLIYFGNRLLTANLAAEADSNAQLSVMLRPPPPSAVPPVSESPLLVLSRSSRPKLSDPIRPRTDDATGLPQAVEDNRSGNLAANPLADTGLPQATENSRASPIDMESAYAIARQYSKSSRGPGGQPANSDPPILERETPLGRSIARSARQDCRTAHAGLGLFAIPMLIADTISDGGCRW